MSADNLTPAPEADLRSYLRVLRRHKWIVVITTLVVVALSVGVSLAQAKKYTATAQVLLEPEVSPTALNATSATISPTDVQTEIQLVTSAPVQQAVAQKLGVAVANLPVVKVSEEGTTNVVQVAATDHSPAYAARIANAYANSYVDFRRTQDVNSLAAAATQMQSRINDLDSQITALDNQITAAAAAKSPTTNLSSQAQALATQEAALKTQQAQLQVNSALATGGAEVVTPATAPTSPSSPKPKRNGLLGLIVGLLLGVGLAFGREYLDDSVKTKDDLEAASSEVTVLGLIPDVVSWRDTEAPRVVSLSTPTSTVAEAYRSLRTSIQFMGLDRPIKILQLTSPNAQEGKSTTLSNLGVVLAQAGQRVCMVCCDLRKPRLHEFFGLDNRSGFTSVLLGQDSLAATVRPALPDQDHLWILSSGPPPPNPSELLASPRTGELFRLLASEFDVVLIDSPPVLPVTDAAVISRHVDATLVVATAGKTTTKEVGRALELLSQVNAPLIGTVLNGVTEGMGYGYEYRYRYGSYSSSYSAPAARSDQRSEPREPNRRPSRILGR